MITAIRIREVLQYCPETGQFRWLPRPVTNHRHKIWNKRYAGQVAGSQDAHGYWVICIDRRLYKAHRLAWLHCHGTLPPEVDHRDCCRTNNRIDNLRAADDRKNAANAVRRKDNTSGFKGVSFHSRRGKWQAQTNRIGQRSCLGYFDTPEEAHEAYKRAISIEHGQFARAA